MKTRSAGTEVQSRVKFYVMMSLVFFACGAALGQRQGVTTGTVTFSIEVVVPDIMGQHAGFMASSFQELDAMTNQPTEDIGDFTFTSRQWPIALPGLMESGSSMSTSGGLNFLIEDIFVDASQGFNAALGSDGNLYMHRPIVNDEDAAGKEVVATSVSELIIVSVVD